jgi:hypothetical protein
MDLDRATLQIVANANAHADMRPRTIGSLIEELGEFALALEGRHEHTPEAELIQLGGSVINMLRQRYAMLLNV